MFKQVLLVSVLQDFWFQYGIIHCFRPNFPAPLRNISTGIPIELPSVIESVRRVVFLRIRKGLDGEKDGSRVGEARGRRLPGG